MTQTLSHHDADNDFQAIVELLGEKASVPDRDYEEEEVMGIVRRARGLLVRAAMDDGVSDAEIGRRLGVSRSLVTRFFRSERDMKVSTLVLIGRALGRRWSIDLEVENEKPQDRSNSVPKTQYFLSQYENIEVAESLPVSFIPCL